MPNSNPITFPTASRPPLRVNPDVLVLVGAPKIGKTTTVACIPDSMVLEIDPRGGDYASGRFYDFDNDMKRVMGGNGDVTWRSKLSFLEQSVIPALQKSHPAKRLVLDHLGVLADWILDDLNARKPMLLLRGGKDKNAGNDPLVSVTELTYGGGERMIAEKLQQIWAQLLECADELIVVCHIQEGGFNPADPTGKNKQVWTGIDLPGQVKRIPCQLGSAIGTLSQIRSADGLTTQLWGDFQYGEGTPGGTRLSRLNGRKICLSQRKLKGESKIVDGMTQIVPVIDPVTGEPAVESFHTYWQNIYLPSIPSK